MAHFGHARLNRPGLLGALLLHTLHRRALFLTLNHRTLLLAPLLHLPLLLLHLLLLLLQLLLALQGPLAVKLLLLAKPGIARTRTSAGARLDDGWPIRPHRFDGTSFHRTSLDGVALHRSTFDRSALDRPAIDWNALRRSPLLRRWHDASIHRPLNLGGTIGSWRGTRHTCAWSVLQGHGLSALCRHLRTLPGTLFGHRRTHDSHRHVAVGPWIAVDAR